MVYFIILFYLLFCAIHFDFLKKKKGNLISYYLILTTLILVAGLRYKVGGDTFSYLRNFEQIPFFTELSINNLFILNYNPGWIILSSISKSIIDDFVFFQLIHATFINIVFFNFFKKITDNKFTAVFIYYLFGFLYFNMEVLRESIAICFFLMAFPSFQQKKWLFFYFWVLLAFLFHSSALILIFLPLFRHLKVNLYTIVLLFLLLPISFVIINSSSILGEFLTILDLNEKYEFYLNYFTNVNGMIGNFLIYIVFPFVVLKFAGILRYEKKFKELILVYFTLGFLYISVSGFGRFLNYMTPFLIVFFSEFLVNLYLSKRYKPIRIPLILLFLVIAFLPKFFYYSMDTSHIVTNTSKYNHWFPYSSIFQKEEFQGRENLHFEGLRLDRER